MIDILLIILTLLLTALAVILIRQGGRPYYYAREFEPINRIYWYTIYYGFEGRFIDRCESDGEAQRLVERYNLEYKEAKKL